MSFITPINLPLGKSFGITQNKLYKEDIINKEKLKAKVEGWKTHALHGDNYNLIKKLKSGQSGLNNQF